jgi:hypothetical protein
MGAPKNQGNGIPLVAISSREGSEVIYATHDFCDQTTWYSESVRVVDDVATDDGAGTVWSLTHQHVIDMYHGHVLDEEALIVEQQETDPGDPHGYVVTVKVDSAEQTMREPYAASGGDYEVNYHAGKITFFASRAGKTVEVSYSYAAASGWVMTPLPGKNLDIESSEAQFSDDLNMMDSIQFIVEGYVQVFAPQLWDGYDPPGPLPTNTRIPLVTQTYKRIDQFVDEALGSFPVVPAIGGATRGNLKARYGFPFRYGTVRRLIHSYGMRLVCRLVHDTPYTGERATATFYCTSNAET